MKIINRKAKSIINREAYKLSKDFYSMTVDQLSILIQSDKSGVPVEFLVKEALDTLREKIKGVSSNEI